MILSAPRRHQHIPAVLTVILAVCLAAFSALSANGATVSSLSTDERQALIDSHLPFGLPSTGELLFRDGYIVSHNNWLKIPNWAAYRLDASRLDQGVERPDDFRPDKELKGHQRSELSDYRGSGYDRGHLAASEDMSVSTAIISSSFLLSNMSPQQGVGFNQHIWADLEANGRKWAARRGLAWVITGPVFQPASDNKSIRFGLIGKHRVAVPSHFFKIFISKKSDDSLDTISFMLPNKKISNRNLKPFLTTIQEIEDLTGLDFLSSLPDDEEKEIEGWESPDLWPLQ